MVDVNLYITAGVGPAECRIALSRVLGLMEARADDLGCQFEVQTLFEGDKHGPKSAIVNVAGANVEAFARDYIGSLKVVFESPLRPSHGRKNWFLGCTRLELPEASASEPDERDLEFESFRAGGPGGQHQNKTDSAVRVRHIPTGIAVVSRKERSQHQNKKEAVRMLARILAAAEAEKAEKGKRSVFMLNKEVERGNPVQTIRL
ncbi:peptide chain release factor H [Agrobacterium salinitolerans]|nr:peptide chain release factor H [Agrobacterium salinitolerans]